MDNNQYLLGIMTDRCRILEQSLIKATELNKSMANELKDFREAAKSKDTEKKVVTLKPKKGDKK